MFNPLKWIFNKATPHDWEHYDTEGPYSPDGHYWNYYRCQNCGKVRIGPKKYADTSNHD